MPGIGIGNAGQQGGVGGLLNVSVAGSSNNVGSVVFSNGGGVTFGLNASTITASVAAGGGAAISAAGASASNGTVVFSNSNNHSFGMNGSTVTVSYAPPLMSSYIYYPSGQAQSSQHTQASASIQQVFLPHAITFSRMDVMGILSLASVANQNTAALLVSSAMVIYTRNASTLSPIIGVSNTTTYTWASNTANFNSLTGVKVFSFPLATSLSSGEYYFGYQMSTNNNSSIGTATTALGASISMAIALPMWNNGMGTNPTEFGAIGGTSSSAGLLWQGLFTATISNTTQTIQQSDCNIADISAGRRANCMLIFRN